MQTMNLLSKYESIKNIFHIQKWESNKLRNQWDNKNKRGGEAIYPVSDLSQVGMGRILNFTIRPDPDSAG